MSFKRSLSASALAAGIGFAGLFGIGLGTASADPWGCDRPGTPHAVTIETTAVLVLSTGMGAASTRPVATISPSTGWASRWPQCPPVTATDGAFGSSASGFHCK